MPKRRPFSSSQIIPVLVEQLQESYAQRAWHGVNLRGSLRGLTLPELCFRPSKDRHNIWEIALHCAYWKYIVRRRLTGEERGSFPLKGSNFFRRPEDKTPGAWKRDIQLLQEMHQRLITAVSDLSENDLQRFPHGSRFTNLQTITGAAMHDVYHAGQIQLLKRLQR